MSYYKKYLKYKNKYLKLKNQFGGNIDDVNGEVKIQNIIGEKMIDTNNTTNTHHPNMIMYDNGNNNDNQIFKLTQHHGHHQFVSKNVNNGCITKQDDDKYKIQECTDKPNQLFKIKYDHGNNVYSFTHPNDESKCLDAAWGTEILSYPCEQHNQNQQFKINKNIINNDNNENHIKPFIQNLILAYTPAGTETFDFTNPTMIAARASEIHNVEGTQSAVWCPLIYRALKYAGESVPESWTLYHGPGDQGAIDDLVRELSVIPGWRKYTTFMLTQYNGPEFDNDFTEELIAKAAEIRDSL